MESSDLRVFEAVARLGSLTRAAAELHTVQSNVTARVRALEDELGVPVFRRHSRGVALTPAGETLLPYAVHMKLLLEQAAKSVHEDGNPRGPLRIGSMETVTAIRLPPVLARYVHKYREVRLTVTTGTTVELLEAVRNWRIDAAFVADDAPHTDLRTREIWREELVLVTHPGLSSLEEALEPGSEVTVIVFRKGCTYRGHLERLLAERGVRTARELEFGTVEGIVGCAAAGLGVSLMPRAVAERAAQKAAIGLHRLPGGRGVVPTVLVQRRDVVASAALERFVECALEELNPNETAAEIAGGVRGRPRTPPVAK